jgi:hypothetical protein
LAFALADAPIRRVKAKAAGKGVSAGSAEVDAFMTSLKHPLKAEIETVRGIIRGLSPAISEEIKWKSPGFRTTESFATVNLRSTDRLQVILHLGAKTRVGLKPFAIDDPAGLVKWLAKDRCMVTVGNLEKERAALAGIVRQWIEHV